MTLKLGLVNLARGGFHWLAPDSGAGSIAGMDLLYPNAHDVVFLLATNGISQLCLGVLFVWVALRRRELVPQMLMLEVAMQALVLLTEYVLKPPITPEPGRFAHMVELAVALAALVVVVLERRRNTTTTERN